MGKIKKVGIKTLDYVQQAAQISEYTNINTIDGGLPLACREFTNMESALLRVRALEDEQLFASGFIRKVPASNLGSDMRVKSYGLDIGEIQTEDGNGRKLRQCKYVFEGLNVDDFEKRFYVCNTNKHLEVCPKDVIGSVLQDWVGDRLADYEQDFENTTMSDIVISAIIEKYRKDFVAKFVLMAVWESEGRNMHGDDGVLAKAWYAHKGQFFHTLEFDLSGIAAGQYLQAREGGKKYRKSIDDFPNLDALLLDFVQWLNNLKDGRRFMYNATIDLTTGKVIVTSAFAVERVRVVIVVNDGSAVDWNPKNIEEDRIHPRCLQNPMMINDTPLMFKYEEICEENFTRLFKSYLKEFKRYLHRNGFDSIRMEDIKIGIDPELMLERADAVANRYLQGGIAVDFMEVIGVRESAFVPLNALNDTGLFFMTIEQNILLFDDSNNDLNGLPGAGRVRVKEGEHGQFQFIFDNPIGSAVEHFGAFAANLCDSWFVECNKLDEKEPIANTKGVLPCYDDNVRRDCVTAQESCSISASASISASYDAIADETTVTFDVSASVSDDLTIVYDLAYSLSDGTSGTGITVPVFDVTLPGDLTASGLVANVFGTVSGEDTTVVPNEKRCSNTVNESVRFEEDDASTVLKYCTWANDVPDDVTDNLDVTYTLQGVLTTTPLVNTVLDLQNPADWDEIEDEIEAILPGTMVEITGTVPPDAVITITNVTSLISTLAVNSALNAVQLSQSCD